MSLRKNIPQKQTFDKKWRLPVLYLDPHLFVNKFIKDQLDYKKFDREFFCKTQAWVWSKLSEKHIFILIKCKFKALSEIILMNSFHPKVR